MTTEPETAPTAQAPASGGRRKHDRRALVVMVTSHAVQHFYVGGLAVTYPLVVVTFHVSYGVLGVVLTAAGLAGGLLQGAAGILRRMSARAVLAAQNILMAAATVLGAVAPGFAVFAVSRFFGSAVSWPQHPVGSAYLSDRFPERRGTVLSWHTVGGSLGTIAVPLFASAIITASGWRWALIAVAAMIAAGGLFVWLALPGERRERLPPGSPEPAAPEFAAEEPAAPEPAAPEFAAEEPAAGPAPEPPSAVSTGSPVWRLLLRRQVALVLAASTVAAAGRGLGTLTTYLPAYLKSGLHVSQLEVGVVFTTVMAASVAGPVLAGTLADRIGRRRLLVGAYLGGAVALAGFAFVGRGLVPLLLTGVAVGLLAYAESPLLQAVFADSIGQAHARAAFGAFFAIAYGVGAIWLAVLGWVIDAFGFTAAFVTMGGSFLVAAILILLTGQMPAATPGVATPGASS